MTTLLKSSQISHNGQPLNSILDGTDFIPVEEIYTIIPPALSPYASHFIAETFEGAELGDFVQVSFDKNLAGVLMTGYVSATDTIVISLFNVTGSTVSLSAGTARVRLTKGA